MFVEILPGLYLGDQYAAQQAEFDLVINCTKNIPFPANTDADLLRIDVDDNGAIQDVLKLKTRMPYIVRIISNELADDHLVLVHCKMGRQRSCAVIAAYLMNSLKCTQEEAITLVKMKKRDAFFPEVNFRDAIINVE